MTAHRPGLRVTLRGEPEITGTTDAVWGQAEVLIKKDCTESPNLVVNEFIANRLAQAIGLPVPAGDIWFDDDTTLHWVIAAVRDRGRTLPPSLIQDVERVDDDLRALMYCFDALINNIDRHEDNILVDSKGNAWLIDHDQALFGNIPRETRAKGLLSTRDRPFTDPGHLWSGPAAPSPAAVLGAVQQIQLLPRQALTAPCRDARARGLITDLERRALDRYLSHRQSNIRSLLDPNRTRAAAPTLTEGDLFSSLAPQSEGESRD